jgi:hypothetical protein
MTAGLDSARFGGADWKPDLELVEKCYARGCYSTRGFDHYGQDSDIKEDLAARIMASPERCPEYLVRIAERRCRRNLSISPAADIAIQEKWFEGSGHQITFGYIPRSPAPSSDRPKGPLGCPSYSLVVMIARSPEYLVLL